MSKQCIETQNHILKLDIPDTYESISAQEAGVAEITSDTHFFRDEDRSCMISVTEKDFSAFENIDLDTIMSSFYNDLSRITPGFKLPFMGKKEINGIIYGALGFYSTTLTTDELNLLFVTLSGNNGIIITMNSLMQSMLWTRPEFLKIMDSAKLENKQKEETA